MPKKTPHYAGHRQRLKARLLENARTLADYEILELLLALTLPRRDTKPLAKELIERFGSLKEAVLAQPGQLDGIKGLGEAARAQWALMQELYARLGEAPARRGQAITGPQDVARAAMARLGHQDIEEFWAVFLDTKNRIIAWERMSKGTTNATAIFPREIAAAALRLDATYVILVHNHPGGGSDPSEADIRLTDKVVDACAALDIEVRDHLIVTDHDFYSFREFGRI